MPAGRVAYLQIPATDVAASSAFYERAFGWAIRTKEDGERSFDDGGAVSGTWVVDRAPNRQGVDGILVWVMVDDVDETLATVVDAGGEIVSPSEPQGEGEAIATVRDPAGNLVGVAHEGRPAR